MSDAVAVLTQELDELQARLANGDDAPVRLRAIDSLREAVGATDIVASVQAIAGDDEELRQALADVVGTLARSLGPDDEPPSMPGVASAWKVLVEIADRLYGSGVAPMGRLPFISDRLLELMLAEARSQLPEQPPEGSRVVASAGQALASVAVSRKLQRAIGTALGTEVVPGYQALYAYDPPVSHVATHVDSRGYELIFHMVLEHELPSDGSPGSALVVHLPGTDAPRYIRLAPGEGVALCGRGTVHSWQPLREGERRTLIDVAWVRG